MLIADRNGMVAGKWLPYDAEIEYLESTGTQWIDTGIKPYQDTAIECSFSGVFNIGTLFGSRNGFGVGQFQAYLQDNANYGILMRIDETTTNQLYRPTQDNYPYDLSMTNLGATVNGTSVIFSSHSATWSGSYNIYLFANNYTGTAGSFASAKVRFFKIYNNSTLVCDLIPVRVGSGANAVGYMYDSVSRKLFGNSGTGEFVLGPDKLSNTGGGN